MVGLKISSKEVKDIIQVLGLTEDEQGKVYLSLLSLGMATLGQISLLSGLDYLKTQEALNVLVGSKLAGRIPGKVGRYFALEPFLKSFTLAYDPITLINVRKEASNNIKTDLQKTSNILDNTVDKFRKNASDLENDFSQSMNPMILEFNGLMDTFRRDIKSTNGQIQEIISTINSSIQKTKEENKKLNAQLLTSQITKLDNLPSIFNAQVPKISQELNSITQNTSDELKQYQNNYNSDLKLFEDSVRNIINQSSENFSNGFKRVQNERSEGQNAFENKIIALKSAIEVLGIKADQNEPKFQKIRNGYSKLNDAIRILFSELNEKLDQMEPVLTSSIEDIQKRKLLKGKEILVSKLTQVDSNKSEMRNILKQTMTSLEEIDSLNTLMTETENDLVNATKKGLLDVQNLVDSEVHRLSKIFQDLKEKIDSNSQVVQEDLEKQRQTLNEQTNDINETLNEKVESFNKNLEDKTSNFVSKLSYLVEKIADDYKNELRTYFEEDKASEVTNSNLDDLLNKTNDINSNMNIELENGLKTISNVDNGFKSYITGMNTFTSNFTDVQVETYIETLNKAREILNVSTVEFEKRIENEISALTFSIKEMKQKINSVFESSRMTEYSELDPSLFTTEIIIGEPTIIMLLRDLTIRAKSSLTVLMPRPELQTMIVASKLPMKTRVSIIGDFRKVPESTLKKVLASGNVRLKQLDGIEFWGCIRDAEELLICPEPKNPEKEELLGVITTNDNLVELFSQEIMTYTTRSREILL